MNLAEHSGAILVHRLGSLGDMVVALPCLQLIRRTYPKAKIVLLTNHPVSGKAAPAMEVLGRSGLCDESMAYPVELRNPHTLLTLQKKIKSHSFKLAVQLTSNRPLWPSVRDYLFFHACGIKQIIGTPFKSRDLPFKHCREPVVEQECSRLARRMRPIGKIDLGDRTFWDLGLTAVEKQSAAGLLRETGIREPFIAASMGTKLFAKDWGEENWIKLARLISNAHPQLGLVLVGVPDEAARSEVVRQAWVGPSANLCGRSSPRVSAAVFERASLFIGHDSGPMHLAAATGIPVVAIFSWHNPPGQWFPGYIGWENIKVFYPPLPNGMWKSELRMRRSPTEGILLVKYQEVAQSCSSFLNRNAN